MIDLHIHSTLSDGTLTPKEIIDRAVANKVSTISIADHDGTLAYTKEIFDYATSQGVQIIPGVEMSTKDGTGFHVLGYGFDLNNKNMQDTLLKLRNARIDYLYRVCEKLNALGYLIDPEELKDIPAVTKANISKNIIANPKNADILKKNFHSIPSYGEFIETIMNEGCPAHTEKYNITPKEASRIIHEAGGKVVLAHPVCYGYEDGISKARIEEIIIDMNADGIEANYIYVDKSSRVIDEIPVWQNVASKLNVFTTMGSDYHASDGIRMEIGFANHTLTISDSEMDTIIANILK